MTKTGLDTKQLDQWQGKFGDEYIDRNPLEERMIEGGKEGFRRMLKGAQVDSILEVGSNIGNNLVYINTLMNGRSQLFAVEPNEKAFSILIRESKAGLRNAWNCSAFDLPLEDSSIDLVFTSGVLIHVAPEDLGSATDEIVRVARKYILCCEYFADSPVSVRYRGEEELLFKRDFGSFYLDRYPELRCLDYGFLWRRESKVFDNVNWWLLEKNKNY